MLGGAGGGYGRHQSADARPADNNDPSGRTKAEFLFPRIAPVGGAVLLALEELGIETDPTIHNRTPPKIRDELSQLLTGNLAALGEQIAAYAGNNTGFSSPGHSV